MGSGLICEEIAVRRTIALPAAAALLGPAAVIVGVAGRAAAVPAPTADRACPVAHICLYNTAGFDGHGVSVSKPVDCTPMPLRSANNLLATVGSAANRTLNLTLHVYASKDCTGKPTDIPAGQDAAAINPAGQSLVVS
jgi:hypothetical protein